MDYKDLKPGDRLEIEQLEAITGEKHGTEAHQLKRMTIRDEIERATTFFVRQDKGALLILSKPAGADYYHDLVHMRRRGLIRLRRRAARNINLQELDPDRRERTKRAMMLTSVMLQAATQEELRQREQDHLNKQAG